MLGSYIKTKLAGRRERPFGSKWLDEYTEATGIKFDILDEGSFGESVLKHHDFMFIQNGAQLNQNSFYQSLIMDERKKGAHHPAIMRFRSSSWGVSLKRHICH